MSRLASIKERIRVLYKKYPDLINNNKGDKRTIIAYWREYDDIKSINETEFITRATCPESIRRNCAELRSENEEYRGDKHTQRGRRIKQDQFYSHYSKRQNKLL